MKKFRQTGSQVIEFALVLPIMLFIILLVIEAGILAFNKAVITHASREAVRRSVMLSAAAWDPAAIEQGACDALRSVLITLDSVKPNSTCTGEAGPTVTVSPTDAPDFGANITVNIAYPVTGLYQYLTHTLSPSNPAASGTILLTASTSMVHE
jgi:Flp pilus assembly protein TadG